MVNNCAAAVLLVLDTFAKGREVVVARNQLVEIGGGFRFPTSSNAAAPICAKSVRPTKCISTISNALLSPQTALLLRVHPSNYSIEGFPTTYPQANSPHSAREWAFPSSRISASGALVDLAEYGLPHERTVMEAVNDGVGLVAFSGDKLLGGPQAGVVLGRANLIARLRDNPLAAGAAR